MQMEELVRTDNGRNRLRTARILNWKRGGILLGAGMTGLAASSVLWEGGVSHQTLGTLMLLCLCASALGAMNLGAALCQVVQREILKIRSLRVRVDVELIAKKRRGNGWYIYADCISPVSCEKIWVRSPLLLDDPKPYLKDGVEVLFDPRYEDRYYMMVETLEKNEVSQ